MKRVTMINYVDGYYYYPELSQSHKPMKYHVELSSGRDFIMETEGTVYDIAWDAYEEACLMDDYLVNVTPIEDV